MRDEKEERKKQARSNKQTRQSNTANVHAHIYIYNVMHVYSYMGIQLITIKKFVNSLLKAKLLIHIHVHVHVSVHVHVHTCMGIQLTSL